MKKTLANVGDANTVQLKDGNAAGAMFTFASGLTGTIVFEGSIEESPTDADFFAVDAMLLPTGTKSTSVDSPAALSAFWIPSGGVLTVVRARATVVVGGSTVSSSRASNKSFFQF